MLFPSLDLPTLFIVSAVVTAFSGGMLVFARGRDRSAVPLGLWGAAMIAGATGIVVLAIRPAFGDLAGRAGYAIILLATGLSWTAARVFAGRSPRPLLVLAGPAGWVAASLAPWAATGAVPTISAQLVGAAYTLATASELWRGRGEPLPSRTAAIVLLLLHAAVYLGCAVATGTSADGGGPSSSWVGALMLEALLHTIGMAFLLLAVMKERAELQSVVHLRELAMLDGLTGLGNRRLFDQALANEFRRATRDQTPLALLMIDADHFKAFNDRYGHQAGDQCLRAIASAIQSAVQRPADLAIRYGGEEFAVLLPGSDEARAVSVGHLVQAKVAGLGIEHTGSPHGRVAVSIGVAATMPGLDLNRPEKLVRSADRALYRAKDAGRNKVLASSLDGPDQPGR